MPFKDESSEDGCFAGYLVYATRKMNVDSMSRDLTCDPTIHVYGQDWGLPPIKVVEIETNDADEVVGRTEYSCGKAPIRRVPGSISPSRGILQAGLPQWISDFNTLHNGIAMWYVQAENKKTGNSNDYMSLIEKEEEVASLPHTTTTSSSSGSSSSTKENNNLLGGLSAASLRSSSVVLPPSDGRFSIFWLDNEYDGPQYSTSHLMACIAIFIVSALCVAAGTSAAIIIVILTILSGDPLFALSHAHVCMMSFSWAGATADYGEGLFHACAEVIILFGIPVLIGEQFVISVVPDVSASVLTWFFLVVSVFFATSFFNQGLVLISEEQRDRDDVDDPMSPADVRMSARPAAAASDTNFNIFLSVVVYITHFCFVLLVGNRWLHGEGITSSRVILGLDMFMLVCTFLYFANDYQARVMRDTGKTSTSGCLLPSSTWVFFFGLLSGPSTAFRAHILLQWGLRPADVAYVNLVLSFLSSLRKG